MRRLITAKFRDRQIPPAAPPIAPSTGTAPAGAPSTRTGTATAGVPSTGTATAGATAPGIAAVASVSAAANNPYSNRQRIIPICI